MTGFADYLDLRLAVSEQVGRRDISDVMPRFVRNAEAYLNKKVRCRDQQTSNTVTFTAGVAPLPTDYAEVITLWDASGCEIPFAERETTRRDPYMASIFGGNIFLYTATGTRELDYYAKLPPLTASQTTSNWLLQKSPNVYLYAVSLEAAKWMKNKDMVLDLSTLLEAELRDLHRDNFRQSRGDEFVRLRNPAP